MQRPQHLQLDLVAGRVAVVLAEQDDVAAEGGQTGKELGAAQPRAAGAVVEDRGFVGIFAQEFMKFRH